MIFVTILKHHGVELTRIIFFFSTIEQLNKWYKISLHTNFQMLSKIFNLTLLIYSESMEGSLKLNHIFGKECAWRRNEPTLYHVFNKDSTSYYLKYY